MLALAEHVGKQSAHHLVYEVSQGAQDRGVPLREALRQRPEVVEALGADAVDAIFDPSRYLGSSGAMVDRVVVEAEGWLGRQP